MDRDEFNSWLERHQTAFPALSDWLGSLPSAKATLEIWFDSMRFLDAQAALAATGRMVSGVDPFVAFANWHDTPRFVAEHCTDIKRQSAPRKSFTFSRVDGQVTYSCRECLDTGVVEVFHGRCVKEVREGTWRHNWAISAATVCTCRIGTTRYAGSIERGIMRMFNSSTDVKTPRDRGSCTIRTFPDDCELILQAASAEVSLEEWAAR